MVLPLLLHLLASLQTLPRPVSPAGLLPAPTLALEQQLTVLLPGKTAELTCQPPGHVQPSGYRFFYQRGHQGPSAVQRNAAGDELVLRAEKGSAGTYTCVYWTEGPNGPVSEHSNSVSISIASEPLFLLLDGDEEEIPPKESVLIPYRPVASIQLSSVAMSHAGVYSCEYWRRGDDKKGPESVSERSQNISIAVTAPLPTPQLSVSPQQLDYVTGESITLTCSATEAPSDSMIRFYKDGQTLLPEELCLRPHQATASVRLSAQPQTSTYTCGCWRVESGRVIESERSQPVSIAVMDPLPPPVLSVDPPSGALSERFPLLLTCTAPGDTGERRFPSYKGGSVTVSVTRILRAGPSNVVEFTCGNKENVSGRWSPSPRGQAVNVTVDVANTAAPPLLVILLSVVGGVLLLLGLLAALLWWGWRKKRVVKPAAGPEPSEPREHARNRDPRRQKKRPEAAQMDQQGSEVAYAHIEFSASNAHATKSKTRARPADEARVLYSEVATKPTHKAPK